jgi:hypothetical protein
MSLLVWRTLRAFSGDVTHSLTRERCLRERRSWKLDPLDPGVDIMITPTSSEARDLIGLAERMGIPTDDAVQSVLRHLTNQELSEDYFDPRDLVRPISA